MIAPKGGVVLNSNRQIFLVEDDSHFGTVLKTVLGSEFGVVLAGSFGRARHLFGTSHFDAIALGT